MLFCARPRGLERTEAEMQVAQNMDPHHCGPCVSRLACDSAVFAPGRPTDPPHVDPARLREQIGCAATKGIPVAAILGSDELAAGRVAVRDPHMRRQAAEHRPLRITSYAHELARAIAQLHRPCPIPGRLRHSSRAAGPGTAHPRSTTLCPNWHAGPSVQDRSLLADGSQASRQPPENDWSSAREAAQIELNTVSLELRSCPRPKSYH